MTKKINVASTLAAAAFGVAAGAAAVGLADRENRQKVGKIVANITKSTQRFAKETNKKTKPALKSARRKIRESLEE